MTLLHGLQHNSAFAVQKDLKILLRDAAEGLPVAKRKATWETERPTVKAIGDAVKSRGFVEYGRYCTVLILCTTRHRVCCVTLCCVQ